MKIDELIDVLLIIAVVALSWWAIAAQRKLRQLARPPRDVLNEGILALADCPECHRAVIARKQLDRRPNISLPMPPWSHAVLFQVTSCTECGTLISERDLGLEASEAESNEVPEMAPPHS